MSLTSRLFASALLALMLLGYNHAAHALTQEQAKAIAEGDSDERIAALNKAVADGAADLEPFVQALLDDAVKIAGDKVYVVRDDKAVDAATGATATLPDNAEDVVSNNRLKGGLRAAQAGLKLTSADVGERRAAIAELGKQSLEESQLPLIDKALAAETDAGLKQALERMRATVLVASPDKAKRLAAVQALAGSGEPTVASLLQERLAPDAETDPEVRTAIGKALESIRNKLAWGERTGVVFTGISLGSILLLAALGLAITYGLMGVINMAHGELIMIGAYATYVTQTLFRNYLPGAFDFYIVAAIPISFLASALVGAAMERSVIRWLYGRPLETLLATWGISLVLMQGVRTLFGAQNVPVENPAWLSGGVSVFANLTLPFNRIAIIVFAALVLGG
ncbi:MAG: urea ABC transporter permease subunit UrtB, partial [Rhizobacter sp.]